MILNNLTEKLNIRKITCPILINSIPKSGTNLLKNIVLSIPGARPSIDLSLANETTNEKECLEYLREKINRFSPGHVYTGHIPYYPVV